MAPSAAYSASTAACEDARDLFNVVVGAEPSLSLSPGEVNPGDGARNVGFGFDSGELGSPTPACRRSPEDSEHAVDELVLAVTFA